MTGCRYVQHLFSVSLFCLSLLALPCCGGGAAGQATALAPGPPGEATLGPAGGVESEQHLGEALAELQALPAPAGAGAGAWTRLKDELARTLALTPAWRRGGGDAAAGGSAGVPARDSVGGQARLPTKATSSPPMFGGSRALLTLDVSTGLGVLKWGLYNLGDYNQDGLVSIADIMPLGARYGEASPGGLGVLWPADTSGAVIDGNVDGVLDVGDVVPVGQNFGRRVQGYRVYRSHDGADVPQTGGDPNGPGTALVADVALADAIAGPGRRTRFELPLADDPAGWFYWVRPYDGTEQGMPSNSVPATPVQNAAPIAVLQAEPGAGLAPLSVLLSGYGSLDLDGEITGYAWDFDGPAGGEEWTSTGAMGWVQHVYAAPGDYLAALRVTDDAGGVGIAYVPVKVRQARQPVPSLSVTPSTGATTLHVVFDAGASSDPDGPIAQYEWDWNGDGVYDYDSGTTPTADFYYYDAGTFATTVRVTDLDGLAATAQAPVVVSQSAQWHVEQVLSTQHDEATEVGYTADPAGLIRLGGAPAMLLRYARSWHLDADHVVNHGYLKFIRATDGIGASWAAPVSIDDGSGNQYLTIDSCDMCIAQGQPYVAYSWSYTPDPVNQVGVYVRGSSFLRANDVGGTSWPAASSMTGAQAVAQLSLIAGAPSMFYGADFRRAADAAGSAWLEPVALPLSSESLAEVAGRPAVACAWPDSGITFAQATDPQGAGWPGSVIRVVAAQNPTHASLAWLGSFPGIAYCDGAWSRLMFVRAGDPDGGGWHDPQTLAYQSTPDAALPALSVIAGRPALFYFAQTGANAWAAFMLVANDAEGASWSLPSLIPVDMRPEQPGSTANIVDAPVDITGRPGLVYLWREREPGVSPKDTKTIEYITYY